MRYYILIYPISKFRNTFQLIKDDKSIDISIFNTTRIYFSSFNHLFFNRIRRLLRSLNRYIMFIKFNKNIFNLILFKKEEDIDIRTFNIVRDSSTRNIFVFICRKIILKNILSKYLTNSEIRSMFSGEEYKFINNIIIRNNKR